MQRRTLESALALDPEDQVALKNLKIVSEYNKNAQDAQDFMEQGDAYYNQKNYEDAVTCYANSIALDDTNPHPYYWIGYCYYNYSAYDTAISYFEKALEVDPNYSAAVKAIKNTKIVAIISALQAVNSSVVSSLNNAYKRAGSSTTTRSTTSDRPSLSTSKNTYSSGSTASVSSETDEKEKAPCYMCDGKGKVVCGRCGGDGKYVDDVCPFCRGTGRATCSTCYGTGIY